MGGNPSPPPVVAPPVVDKDVVNRETDDLALRRRGRAATILAGDLAPPSSAPSRPRRCSVPDHGRRRKAAHRPARAHEDAALTFENTWQDIAERIVPRKALFKGRDNGNQTKGQRLTEKIFDATPALALDRFAAAAHSLVVPRNQVWQKFKASKEELNKNVAVQRYFDELTRVVFAARYAATSTTRCTSASTTSAPSRRWCSTSATPARGCSTSVPMWQAYFAENKFGVVDCLNREYWMTARQAVSGVRRRTRLRPAIKTAARTRPSRVPVPVRRAAERDDMDVERARLHGHEVPAGRDLPDLAPVVKARATGASRTRRPLLGHARRDLRPRPGRARAARREDAQRDEQDDDAGGAAESAAASSRHRDGILDASA
jgi:hypothetical protein